MSSEHCIFVTEICCVFEFRRHLTGKIGAEITILSGDALLVKGHNGRCIISPTRLVTTIFDLMQKLSREDSSKTSFTTVSQRSTTQNF